MLQAAPELPCGLAENVKERIALRCLEDLCARQSRRTSEISSSQGSRIEFDMSESCENVLQRIVKEVSTAFGLSYKSDKVIADLNAILIDNGRYNSLFSRLRNVISNLVDRDCQNMIFCLS